MDNTIHFIAEEDGIRIDKFLSQKLPEQTRSYIQKLVKDEKVLVNNHTIKSNYKVTGDDEITIEIPEPTELLVEPEDIPLNILYEDLDIIIVNKPKGMVVHPSAGHSGGTLVNALMYHCKDQLSGINGVLRPGIVHRIDMDTTGSLLVCKTDFAHQALAEQLKDHSITRKYHAIVHGNITKDDVINAPIGRHPVERKKMSTASRNGREAITHYHVIERFKEFTYIECQLETGRTHQIRVHMASIGHPILGDALYGPRKCPVKNLQGQTLHAKVLGFVHPRTGEYVEYDAPLPEYFEKLLVRFRSQI